MSDFSEIASQYASRVINNREEADKQGITGLPPISPKGECRFFDRTIDPRTLLQQIASGKHEGVLLLMQKEITYLVQQQDVLIGKINNGPGDEYRNLEVLRINAERSFNEENKTDIKASKDDKLQQRYLNHYNTIIDTQVVPSATMNNQRSINNMELRIIALRKDIDKGRSKPVGNIASAGAASPA